MMSSSSSSPEELGREQGEQVDAKIPNNQLTLSKKGRDLLDEAEAAAAGAATNVKASKTNSSAVASSPSLPPPEKEGVSDTEERLLALLRIESKYCYGYDDDDDDDSDNSNNINRKYRCDSGRDNEGASYSHHDPDDNRRRRFGLSSNNCQLCQYHRHSLRLTVVEWSYRVADHYGYDREVASVALHNLDRFAFAVSRAFAAMASEEKNDHDGNRNQDYRDDVDDDGDGVPAGRNSNAHVDHRYGKEEGEQQRQQPQQAQGGGEGEMVPLDDRTYYLAAVTSLYISVKLSGAATADANETAEASPSYAEEHFASTAAVVVDGDDDDIDSIDVHAYSSTRSAADARYRPRRRLHSRRVPIPSTSHPCRPHSSREFNSESTCQCCHCRRSLRLGLRHFVTLAQDQFSPDEIASMELHMSFALRWRLNPPSAVAFVPHLLGLLHLCFEEEEEEEKEDDDDGNEITSGLAQHRRFDRQRSDWNDRRRRHELLSLASHVIREVSVYLTELASCSPEALLSQWQPLPFPPPPGNDADVDDIDDIEGKEEEEEEDMVREEDDGEKPPRARGNPDESPPPQLLWPLSSSSLSSSLSSSSSSRPSIRTPTAPIATAPVLHSCRLQYSHVALAAVCVALDGIKCHGGGGGGVGSGPWPLFSEGCRESFVRRATRLLAIEKRKKKKNKAANVEAGDKAKVKQVRFEVEQIKMGLRQLLSRTECLSPFLQEEEDVGSGGGGRCGIGDTEHRVCGHCDDEKSPKQSSDSELLLLIQARDAGILDPVRLLRGGGSIRGGDRCRCRLRGEKEGHFQHFRCCCCHRDDCYASPCGSRRSGDESSAAAAAAAAARCSERGIAVIPIDDDDDDEDNDGERKPESASGRSLALDNGEEEEDGKEQEGQEQIDNVDSDASNDDEGQQRCVMRLAGRDRQESERSIIDEAHQSFFEVPPPPSSSSSSHRAPASYFW